MSKLTDEIRSLYDKEYNIWSTAISKADDSTYGVLISHLYFEHLIERYLSAKLNNTKPLFGKGGLSFSNKLKLTKSFSDIDEQIIDSLFKLNEIRNNWYTLLDTKLQKKRLKDMAEHLAIIIKE